MYQLNKRQRQSSGRRRFFVAGGLLVFLTLITLGGYQVFRSRSAPPAPANQPPQQSAESIKSEREAGDAIKPNIAPPEATPTTPPAPGSAKKSVTPVIITASGTEVRAFVPGLVENGGTCTLTLTKTGETTITKSQPATANATTTDCQVFSLATSASGWTAKVTYSSSAAQGDSEAIGVQ